MLGLALRLPLAGYKAADLPHPLLPQGVTEVDRKVAPASPLPHVLSAHVLSRRFREGIQPLGWSLLHQQTHSVCWVPWKCPSGLMWLLCWAFPKFFTKCVSTLTVGMHGFLITLLHCCFPYKMHFVKSRHCSLFSAHATRRYVKNYVNFSVKALMLSHAIHITLLMDQFCVYIECWDKANVFILRKYFASVSSVIWNSNCNLVFLLKFAKGFYYLKITSSSSTWRQSF